MKQPIVQSTIRLDKELDKQWKEYSKQHYLSKNQVVNKALRELFASNATGEKQLQEA